MNHIGEIAQLISSIVLALTFMQSWTNGRAIKAVKAQTDGINAQLVKTTGEAEHAKGVLAGAQEEHDNPR